MASNSWYRLHAPVSTWSPAESRRSVLRGGADVQKRLLDLAIASFGLLVLSPVLILVAMVVKLDSPGPVLFRSRRMGRHGHPFECLKVRTMTEDSRVTRVGALLRRFGLDELPQLFNVLAGEMSVVGPRPVLASGADDLKLRQMARFTIKPGITGLWHLQEDHYPVFGQYVSADEAYRENWTLGLDLRIILRSAAVAFQGRGC